MACSHVNDDTRTSGNGATLAPGTEEIVRIRTVIGLPDSLLPRAAAIICHAYFYRFSSVSCSDEETLAILRESLNDRTLIGAFLGEELVGLAVLRSGGRPRVKKPSSFLRSLLIRCAPVNKADIVIIANASAIASLQNSRTAVNSSSDSSETTASPENAEMLP